MTIISLTQDIFIMPFFNTVANPIFHKSSLVVRPTRATTQLN